MIVISQWHFLIIVQMEEMPAPDLQSVETAEMVAQAEPVVAPKESSRSHLQEADRLRSLQMWLRTQVLQVEPAAKAEMVAAAQQARLWAGMERLESARRALFMS